MDFSIPWNHKHSRRLNQNPKRKLVKPKKELGIPSGEHFDLKKHNRKIRRSSD